MAEISLGSYLPYLDQKQQRIIDEIRRAGGDVYRDALRGKIGGSNTTFIKKIEHLKKMGLLEEYKKSNGRMKTAYRLTSHSSRIFNIAKLLKMEKWFSASQKIELFPEFQRMAKRLTGSDIDVYKMLGIEPQHISIETSLAASESPPVKEEEVREVLSICNALLQNMVTTRLHKNFGDSVEGYIIFHYKLEKPKEELQRILPQCIMDYVESLDPLEQHKASSKLVELTIRYSDVLPMLTMAALNIAQALLLKKEKKELIENYTKYKKKEGFEQANRIEVVLSSLKIFRALHEKQKTT